MPDTAAATAKSASRAFLTDNAVPIAGAINDISSFFTIRNEFKMRQLAYEHNRLMAENEKWFIDRAAKKREEQIRKEGGRVLAAARVANASSGFALTSVSSLDAEGAIISSIEEDAAAIRTAGSLAKFQKSVEQSQDTINATAARAEGRIRAGSTMLETAIKLGDRYL